MEDTQDTAPAAEVTETTEPVAPVEEGAEVVSEETQEPQETEEERIERIAEERAATKAQKRINELTYKYREAERRAEALAAAQATRKEEPTAPAQSAEPRIEDYEDINAFLRDRDEWMLSKFDQRLTEREQRAHQVAEEQRARQEWQDKHRSFETAEREYIASLPPERAQAYNAAAAQLDPILLDHAGAIRNPNMVRALMEAGPQVVEALAANLDLAAQLVTADPLTIGREIGKLERSVGDGGRLGRRFSKAAPPTPILSGGGAPAGPVNYESLSGADYARVRAQEEAARRQSR